MRILACLILVVGTLASCTDDDVDTDGYPVAPGGVPTETGTTTGTAIRGRVCRLVDITVFNGCASAAANGGLSVTLGDTTVITAADGSFEIPMPTTAFQDITVSGLGAITTTTPFSPSPLVPVIDADVWARTLRSNVIRLPGSSGSIIGSVIRNGLPVNGVTVVTDPVGPFGPFYDPTGVGTGFGLVGTGARGVFFTPGVPVGASNLSFLDPSTGAEAVVNEVAVLDGGVTVLDSIVMP